MSGGGLNKQASSEEYINKYYVKGVVVLCGSWGVLHNVRVLLLLYCVVTLNDVIVVGVMAV